MTCLRVGLHTCMSLCPGMFSIPSQIAPCSRHSIHTTFVSVPATTVILLPVPVFVSAFPSD